MAAIEVKEVSKNYRDPADGREVSALGNVSLSATENDFLVLLGPSGCGKSTLLNIIAGLIPHDDRGGEVLVQGRRVTGPNPKLMAYMFQDPVLYPWRTVLKNVEFGLEAQQVDKEERRRRALKYLQKALRALLDSTEFIRSDASWTINKMKQEDGYPDKGARWIYDTLDFSTDGVLGKEAVENTRRVFIEYGIISENTPRAEQLYTLDALP